MSAPRGTPLAGRHIVLGLTGGVACYKAAELARELQRAGATVQAVLTDAAQQFITPLTLQALTGRTALTSQRDQREPNAMAHINLTRGADAVLVAPAMNREMWSQPATQRNAAQAVADGAVLLGPRSGEQACGETGDGRMLEPAELCDAVVAHFQHKLLAGRRVLVTAGPTYEPIDPVRGLINLSSGKMGFAVARAAAEAGAAVTGVLSGRGWMGEARETSYQAALSGLLRGLSA
jgi:phosphopantothenoylcysteine decarboxylase/phosphopantothenate--cysteine ligase